MAHSNTIQIRVDPELRARADALFAGLGIDTPTAVRIFLSQAVMRQGIPFALELDPFYSEANMRSLRRSISELDAGKVVVKTPEELEAME